MWHQDLNSRNCHGVLNYEVVKILRAKWCEDVVRGRTEQYAPGYGSMRSGVSFQLPALKSKTACAAMGSTKKVRVLAGLHWIGR